MTYTLNIDQTFAMNNGLSLTQVTTLAAFMTLPTWTKNIAIDGHVWYMYSDEKMAEDFPLLFGVAKRCYKNITELAELGFVELTKLGRTKYVRFTDRCQDWGKEKGQFWSDGPKTDQKKSENGLNDAEKSPKTDRNYNINITKDINTINTADGGLFPVEEFERGNTFNAPTTERKENCAKEKRGTAENLCLFANSRFNRFEDFAACFIGPEFRNVDVAYYHAAVADWSAQKGKKMKDWIATARNFMRSDMERNKLHTIGKPESSIDYESFKRYCEM